jgi:gamma-glutamylcyclotransferase (GGCT)/AIG2-like uncharacterized protein YtfP
VTNYIFGYGSLMNSSSRQLTGQTGKTYPAIAQGLIRYWGQIETTIVASPLVADFGDGQINGVLLEVDTIELAHFDKREHGYQRHDIEVTKIHSEHTLNEKDRVWIYIKKEPLPPCEVTPVLQTYIDTVLEGCLEVSESFAQFFIENTQGWQYPICNDRQQPRYTNYAGVEPTKLSRIDSLLEPVMGNR